MGIENRSKNLNPFDRLTDFSGGMPYVQIYTDQTKRNISSNIEQNANDDLWSRQLHGLSSLLTTNASL